MTREEINARLGEYETLGPRGGETQLSLLQTAMYLEEAFGLRLEDADITAANLGSHDALLRFVEARLRVV